jgi:hypothetical protein
MSYQMHCQRRSVEVGQRNEEERSGRSVYSSSCEVSFASYELRRVSKAYMDVLL